MLLLSLFVTAKETCSGERGRERRKRGMERKGKERGREGGDRGEGERVIVLSKEISCLQHMTHVVVQ